MSEMHGNTPYIIIGMHRSGTSLVANLLNDLGLYIGWQLDNNTEATFFRERNERILNACNGSWDNPKVFDALLGNSGLRRKVTDLLSGDLRSFNVLSYLGPEYFKKYKSVFNLDIPWGWKDPRNTVLLPIWCDIFPKAKIIHVYRNGVDVANSLSVRENRRLKSVFSDENSISSFYNHQVKLFRKQHLPLYVYQKITSFYRLFDPLRKYSQIGIRPTISIENGFELWSYYIETALKNIESRKERCLEVKYEDLLSSPEKWLKKLQTFCGLPTENIKFKSIVDTINPKRKYAYKYDEHLPAFYQSVKNNQWLEKLGYCNVE